MPKKINSTTTKNQSVIIIYTYRNIYQSGQNKIVAIFFIKRRYKNVKCQFQEEKNMKGRLWSQGAGGRLR